jgi:hypothetical protein
MSAVLEQIRAKFPQYSDIGDDLLVSAIGDKYPVYLFQDPEFDAEYTAAKNKQFTPATPSQPVPRTGPRSTTYGGPSKPLASLGETLADFIGEVEEVAERMGQPIIQMPKFDIKETDHPMVQIGKEAVNIAAGVPEFLTSPVGISSTIMGVGAPQAMAKVFTGVMLKDLGEQIWNWHKNWPKMTPTQKRIAVTDAVASGVFAALAAKGGFGSTTESTAAAGAPLTAKSLETLGSALKTPKGAVPPAEPSLTPQAEAAAREVTAAPILEPKAEDASEKREDAEIHGDVLKEPEQGAGEVPEPRRGGGVQSEAQGGIPEEKEEVAPPTFDPAKTGPITAAAYKDPKTGQVFTAPTHLEAARKAGIAEGFETEESRNGPEFGFQTEREPFVPRDQSDPIRKYWKQDMGEPASHGGMPGLPGSGQTAAKPGGETPLSETPVAPQAPVVAESATPEPAKPLPEAEAIAPESTPAAKPLGEGEKPTPVEPPMPNSNLKSLREVYENPNATRADLDSLTSKLSEADRKKYADALAIIARRIEKAEGAAARNERMAQPEAPLDIGHPAEESLTLEEPSPQPPAKEGEAKPPGPSDVGPGLGGAIPSEFGGSQSLVSNMFAVIDADREARGLEPMPPAEGRSWDQDEKIAMGRMNRDPEWIPNLIKQVTESPRPLLSWEQAGMVFTKAKWKAEENNALRRIATAFEDGRQDDLSAAKVDAAVWADKLQEMEDAVGRGGTGSEAGRSLQAQKMGVNEDFDLVEAVMQKRGARGGKPLSDEEVAALRKEVDDWKAKDEKYRQHIAERDKRIADLEAQRAMEETKRAAEAAKGPGVSKYVLDLAEKWVKGWESEAEKARQTMAGKFLSPTPEDILNIARIARADIGRLGLDFAKWSDRMIKEVGPKIQPYLQEAWDKAVGMIEGQIGKAPEKYREPIRKAVAKQDPAERQRGYAQTIKAKLDKGEKGKITYYLQRLARGLYAEGVTDRDEMVDRLTDTLHDAGVDMDRREVSRAWSGYGDYRQLSKDEISVALRGMKGELQQIAKLEDMEAGQPPLKSGVARREPADAEKKLIKLVNDAKNKFQIPITDPETQLKSSLDTLKAAMRSRIEDYEDRLARGDFAPRPRREIQLDAEALRLKADAERVKKRFREGLIADRLKNRTRWEKIMDWVTKYRRSGVLTSPTVIPKLVSAGLQRLAAYLPEESAGWAWERVPGVSSVAAKAPLEGGGPNLKAEMRGYGAAFTQGMKDAYDVMKTRHSELDVLYGKAAESYTGESELGSALLSLPGRVHGMIKAPIKRAAFERAAQRLGEYYANQGLDVNDPLTQARITVDAYKAANRAIFLQDNWVASKVSAFIGGGAKKPTAGQKAWSTAGRVLLPITKVPINIVAETLQYVGGWVSGGSRILAHALFDGARELKPEEADLIMRHLKKGSVGPAVVALGYWQADKIGGTYQPGQRKDPDAVPFGNIRLFGKNIPAWLLHNPLLECLQVGATVRHVAESQLKKGAENQGLTAGMLAAALGIADDVPFVREMWDLEKVRNPRTRNQSLGEQAKSIAIPAAVQRAAEWTDSAEERKPTTTWEAIKSGIPGARQTVPEEK